MSEIVVHVEKNEKIVDSMNVKSETTVSELKCLISILITKDEETFDLYLATQHLDATMYNQSLNDLGVSQEVVLQIVDKNNTSNELMLVVEYGMETIRLHVFGEESVNDLKRRVGGIFGCLPSQFDLMIKDETMMENAKIIDLGIKNNTTVTIKRKIPMEGGLGSKIRMASSILSCSDPADEKSEEEVGNSLQVNSIQKKNSCCSSLSNINEHEGHKKNTMKTSSIEPFSHKESEIGKQEHRLTRIEDIKETKSFGSLEESKTDELDVEVVNEQETKIYRFTCPLGCRVGQLRTLLSRQERINIENVELSNSDDNCLIESLGEADELPKLLFKIKNQQ